MLEKFKNKDTGFRAPKGYFPHLEDQVMSALFEDQLPKKEGYTIPKGYLSSLEKAISNKLKTQQIPDGYFDTLEDRILEKIDTLNQKEVQVIPLQARLKRMAVAVTMAASLALIFILGYNTAKKEVITLAGNDIDALVEEGYVDLGSYEVAEVFSDVELLQKEEDAEILDYINDVNAEILLFEN